MKRILSNRTIVLFMALVLIVTMAACGEKAPEQKPSATIPPIINLLPDPEAPEAPTGPVEPSEETIANINEKYAINTDVKGWLTIPNTTINREVLQYADDQNYIRNHPQNQPYYERKDIYGNYDFNGSVWADYECKVSGDRNDMSKNTIIYGHSMSDDPNGAEFSQLKLWRSLEFAKQNPSFTFTTPLDEMTFQIFAVVETETDYGWYIYADGDAPKTSNFAGMSYQQVLDKMRDQSLWDYTDIDVNTDDKIIVLSTCTYPNGDLNSSYNHRYKYLLVGRLLRDGEELNESPTLVENKDRQISPGR